MLVERDLYTYETVFILNDFAEIVKQKLKQRDALAKMTSSIKFTVLVLAPNSTHANVTNTHWAEAAKFYVFRHQDGIA